MNKFKTALLTSALMMAFGGNAYSAEDKAGAKDAAGRVPSNQMRAATGSNADITAGEQGKTMESSSSTGAAASAGTSGMSTGASGASSDTGGTARGLDNAGVPTASPSVTDDRMKGDAIRPENAPATR